MFITVFLLSYFVTLGSFLHPTDDGHMQYWSENHQSGWYCGQYLVGHAFSTNPDLADIVFHGVNNTGHVHYIRGKERLQRWLDYRGRFGFSEYNADTYAPIAYNPLVTVAALAPDKEVKTLAEMITFLQLFDWILSAHKGEKSGIGFLRKLSGLFHKQAKG